MAIVRKIGLLPQTFGGCIQPISNWPPYQPPLFPIAFHPSYFIEGNLDMVMALYWRVRAFQVIANTFVGGNSYSDTFTMRPDDEDGETSGFATETDLICGGFDWYLRTSYGPTDFTSGMSGAYVDDSDNYFVSFAINDGYESYRSEYRPTSDYGTIGTWELNFSGYSITKPLYRTLPVGVGNIGPASIVMNAVQYWPYDPEDGSGPMYNSTTGVRLKEV